VLTTLSQGIDTIDIERMRRALERGGSRFMQRIFTGEELLGGEDIVFLATRFAAKEAFFKALGTGLSGGVRWRDFSLPRGESGHLLPVISGKSLNLLGKRKVLVDVASTAKAAVAVVFLA